MTLLLLGLLLFLGTHAVHVVAPGWRARMITRHGEMRWKGGYAIVALLGLVLAAYAPAVMGVVEELTGFSIVAGTYFDQIPTDIRWPDILVIALVTFLISFGFIHLY